MKAQFHKTYPKIILITSWANPFEFHGPSKPKTLGLKPIEDIKRAISHSLMGQPIGISWAIEAQTLGLKPI